MDFTTSQFTFEEMFESQTQAAKSGTNRHDRFIIGAAIVH